MTIKFYKTNEPYGFLNNFYKAPFTIYGRRWNNVEAAYQAQKTIIPGEYEKIWATKTPREARDMGQLVQMKPNWDDIKTEVMLECVLAKFSQNQDLKEQLLATNDKELIEDSPIDNFWGCGADGTGKNMLGKILMDVRAELKNNSKKEAK